MRTDDISHTPALETDAPAPKSGATWRVRHRWQIIAAVLLVVVALGVRLSIVDRWFPFVDYTDEGVYVAWGMHLRGVSDESALVDIWGILSPLYVSFSAIVQGVFDAVKTYDYLLPADYYTVLRWLSAGMGALTALCMMIGVGRVAGGVSGWLVGMIWALSPRIVLYNSLAIPDPAVYLATAFTLMACVLAWQMKSPRWVLAGLLGGIALVYLKYWIVFPLMVVVLVGFGLFAQNPRKWRNWMIVYATISAVTAFVLLVVIDPLGTTNDNKLGWFTADELIAFATDPARLQNNLRMSLITFHSGLFWWSLVAGLGAYALSWRRGWRRIPLGIIGVTLAYIVIGSLLTAAISNVSPDGRLRHILPTSIGFFGLWGFAIGQLIWAAQHWLDERGAGQRRPWVGAGVAALVALVVLPVYLPRHLDNYRTFQQEHVVNQLRDWSDDNLPQEGLVMFVGGIRTDLDRVWNRTWGAYTGDKPFVWWTEPPAQIASTEADDYLERGIYYFTINEGDLARIGRPQALLDWMDAQWLIKTFPADAPTIAGHTTYVYRLARPQHDAAITFGEQIRLIGYDATEAAVAAGAAFAFRPYWERVGEINANYNLFIHLHTPDDLTPLAQHDGPLSVPERPTLAWDDPDEVYIGGDAVLTVPPDLPAGDYVLTIGVYDYQTGGRLPTDSGDAFQLPLVVR